MSILNSFKLNGILRAPKSATSISNNNTGILNKNYSSDLKHINTLSLEKNTTYTKAPEKISNLQKKSTSKFRKFFGLRAVIIKKFKESIKTIHRIEEKYQKKEIDLTSKTSTSITMKDSQAIGNVFKEIKDKKNTQININFDKIKTQTTDLIKKLETEQRERTRTNKPIKQLEKDITKLKTELKKIKIIERSTDIHNEKIKRKAQSKIIGFKNTNYDHNQSNKVKSKTDIESMRKTAKSEARLEKFNEIIKESSKDKVRNKVISMIQDVIKENNRIFTTEGQEKPNTINIKNPKEIFDFVEKKINSKGKTKESLAELKALKSIEKEVHEAGVGIGNSRSL